MTCAARRSARWLSAAPNAKPVFLYFFDQKLSAVPIIEAVSKATRRHIFLLLPLFSFYANLNRDVMLQKPMGVFHGSELALVFDFKELLLESKERSEYS